MPQRSSPIIDPKMAQAIATLGTGKATDTARIAAAKTVHAALLVSDSRASAREMVAVAQDMAVALKAQDSSIEPVFVGVAMRSHLMRTGDLSLPNPDKRAAASPAPAPDTDDAPAFNQAQGVEIKAKDSILTQAIRWVKRKRRGSEVR